MVTLMHIIFIILIVFLPYREYHIESTRRSKRDESPEPERKRRRSISPLRTVIDLTQNETKEKSRRGVKWYAKMPCAQRWYSTSIWLSEPDRITAKNHKAIEAHLIKQNLNGLSDEGCLGQRVNHLDGDKKPPCGSVHHVDPTGGMYNGKPLVHQTVWSADGANLYLATTCNDTKCTNNARNALIKMMQQYPMTVGPFLH